jgi:hypothetical protein
MTLLSRSNSISPEEGDAPDAKDTNVQDLRISV